MLYQLKQAAFLLTHGRCDMMTLPWHRLTYVHMAYLRTTLGAQGKAPQTCNTMLYAVKGVLKQCQKLGYMSVEQQVQACEVEPIRGHRLPAGRWVTVEELEALFRSCVEDERRILGARDAALIAVLYGLGLRRAEAADLDNHDYQPDSGEVRVRHGKGNRERTVYANAPVNAILHSWLVMRGRGHGPLIARLARAGHMQPSRLTTRGINLILHNRAAQAGVPHFTPHDCRRSFVSSLLQAGTDLATVQQLAGHANIQTTAIYDRRGEQAKKAAVPLLPVPYPGHSNTAPSGMPEASAQQASKDAPPLASQEAAMVLQALERLGLVNLRNVAAELGAMAR